ncbi:hypothetical protein SAMN05660199_00178 [Klenkia soli]|uniref:Uncharacterized protein n=2 Tax=Klenkia soli TaxID=1052260 RepID=A0A1H0C1D8_9ACTN|nr:hypothetical protein SAMN05660199_00178 [Klenkia soli]
MVPAEAGYDAAGVPNQSKINPIMKLILPAFRACPVCGFAIKAEDSVYRLHDTYSRQATREELRRDQVSELDIFGHRICMLYSAMVCPFWRSSRSKFGKDSAFHGDGKRGPTPSLMGFRDYAVLVDATQPVAGPTAQQFVFVCRQLVEDTVFDDPFEAFADQYDRDRKATGGSLIRGRRRHYAPELGGVKRLQKDLMQVLGSLRTIPPDAIVDLEGREMGLFGSGWL